MTSSRLDPFCIRRSLRVLALSAPLALVAACSSDQNSEWGTVYSMFSQSFGFAPSGVTRDQAAAIPFASMGVRVDDGPEGMLVLGTSTSGTQLWTAASHIVLLIRDGRILRTAGLGHDRTDMRILRGDDGPPPLQGSGETVWSEDFGDLHLFLCYRGMQHVGAGAGNGNQPRLPHRHRSRGRGLPQREARLDVHQHLLDRPADGNCLALCPVRQPEARAAGYGDPARAVVSADRVAGRADARG